MDTPGDDQRRFDGRSSSRLKISSNNSNRYESNRSIAGSVFYFIESQAVWNRGLSHIALPQRTIRGCWMRLTSPEKVLHQPRIRAIVIHLLFEQGILVARRPIEPHEYPGATTPPDDAPGRNRPHPTEFAKDLAWFAGDVTISVAA
jgi:hypothetical protein